MRTSRLSLGLRTALFVAAGSTLIVAPFALGLGPAALVTGVAVGALAMALGFAGTGDGGRGTLPLRTQASYDRGLALGLVAAGVIFGLADERAALLLFGASGVLALAVSASTRYSPSRT